jgi:ABC-type enterochelin transport system permease subunit
MNSDDAAARLARVDEVRGMSAKTGAWITSLAVAVAVVAIGVVVDLEMLWLLGLVVLGLVGLWAVRPLRSRLQWSDRVGTALVVGGAVLALVADIAVQFPVRAAGWAAPNTIGALAAAVVILLVCRAGLQRLATAAPTPASGAAR